MSDHTLRGDQLAPEVQRQALDKFIYRMTVEAQQRWPHIARWMRGTGWRMPDRTDAEWLKATEFHVTNSGKLDQRYNHCLTSWNGR